MRPTLRYNARRMSPFSRQRSRFPVTVCLLISFCCEASICPLALCSAHAWLGESDGAEPVERIADTDLVVGRPDGRDESDSAEHDDETRVGAPPIALWSRPAPATRSMPVVKVFSRPVRPRRERTIATSEHACAISDDGVTPRVPVFADPNHRTHAPPLAE